MDETFTTFYYSLSSVSCRIVHNKQVSDENMLEICVTYRYNFAIVIKLWAKMRLFWGVSLYFFLGSMSLYAANDLNRQLLQERIKPVGQVRVQKQVDGEKTPGTNNQVIIQAQSAESGQDTYEHFCIVCHRDGLAGAPKARDADDWKPRTSGKTIDDLVKSSINGLNAMPPKGTCSECSEDDLKAAIQYMLPK